MLAIARLIALLIVAQGVLGLLAPEFFFRLVQAFQVPPVLYVAALVRVAFGGVLLLVSSTSRVPFGLRLLGGIMLVGGLLTPFFGASFARVILGSWSEGGAPIIRAWAGASLLIGIFIAYATSPIRRPAA
jgi:hypothetical protein